MGEPVDDGAGGSVGRPAGGSVGRSVDDAAARRTGRVLRSRGGLATAVIAVVVSLYLVIDALVRGYPGVALRSLVWLAVVCWLVTVVFARPCLVISGAGVAVHNPWRTHRMDWAAVDTIRERPSVTVMLTRGGRITSWGAPARGLAKQLAGEAPPDAARVPTVGRAAETMALSRVQAFYDPRSVDPAAEAGSDEVRSSWDRADVIGSAVALALVALGVVLLTV